MIVNYNTPLNTPIDKNDKKNVKTINKKIITLNDLDIIDANLDKSNYLLIKNDQLTTRDDFDIDEFYSRYIKQYPEVDIFILSGYHEKCKDLTKTNEYDDYTFFKSRMPGEIEAFAIKSNNWNKIKILLEKSKEEKINSKLKNLILHEELNAEFVWPQAYYFKNKFNLMKICREEKESFISPRVKELSYYWFFVTFIFTIIFTYFGYFFI